MRRGKYLPGCLWTAVLLTASMATAADTGHLTEELRQIRNRLVQERPAAEPAAGNELPPMTERTPEPAAAPVAAESTGEDMVRHGNKAESALIIEIAKAELYHTPEEKREIANTELLPGLNAGVLLEFEAGFESQDGESASSFSLATFELALEADVFDWLKGRALLLWEDGDDPVVLDEAAITAGGTDTIPFTVEGGKLYVPFGVLSTHMVSDPIVLEMAETRESALTVSYCNNLVEMAVAAFNGALDDPTDDNITDIAALIRITPAEGVQFGVYAISDIGEADGLEGIINENMAAAEEDALAEPLDYSAVPGVGWFFGLEIGQLMVDAELVTATEAFDTGLLGDTALQPSAWNVEVAFRPNDDWELAVKVEGSEDLPDQPETQYGVGVSHGINDRMNLGAEYLRGVFADGEGDRDLVTVQLALEF